MALVYHARMPPRRRRRSDTIGADIKAKKVRLALAKVGDRTALFVAGKADAQTVQMACEAFNGQSALSA